jgi:type I restriction enzyme S subunit
MTEKIPKEWIQTKLEYVINKMCNGLTKRQNKEGKGFPVSRIETISMGRIDYSKVGFVENVSEEVIVKYKLIVGDILFSHINSDFHLGKTAIVNSTRKELLHGMNLLLIRVNRNILIPLFLHYLFNYYRYAGSFIKIAQHAVNQSSLNQAKLKNLDVTLPPLPEQHKIVERIEELFTKLDVGVEALKKVKEQIKQYRQSVLKSAFEGKLTVEWRKENPNPEKYLENLRERIEVFNREKRNKDKPSRLPPIDFSDLAEIPFPWIWIEAHKVCQSVRDGTHDTPKYVNKGIPLVTSKNLVKGRIDFTNVNYISTEDHLEINKRSKVDQGDILFGMIGTIGNPVIVKTDSIFSIKNVGLFKRNDNFILFKYLRYWLKSEELKRMLEKKHLIRGTTQKFIALGNLRVLPIPLPTLKEQQKIVEEIEKRFSIADEVEETVDESLKQAEKLRQSILKKAFEGKLTEKWREEHPELVSGENSAEKLLEKIKKEKAKMEAEMKNKKGKKKQGRLFGDG